MCLRLSNACHCLTFLSILGLLQSLIAVPIIALSFVVFAKTSLGVALSPFWCGFVLLLTGVVAVFIRPSRLAIVIVFHVILNSFSIATCFLSGGITGLYGTSVQLNGFDELQSLNNGSMCIFSETSTLYTEPIRNTFHSIDSLLNSCEDLAGYWEYLVALMSLSVMGLLVSLMAIISNCITPCCAERYEEKWAPSAYSNTDV